MLLSKSRKRPYIYDNCNKSRIQEISSKGRGWNSKLTIEKILNNISYF